MPYLSCMATTTAHKEQAMNATIAKTIAMKGARTFVKGERVNVLNVSTLYLSWLDVTEHSFTVEDGDRHYSVPFNNIVLDEGVELEGVHQTA